MARNAVVKVNGEIVATYSDEVSSSGSDPYSWTWRWRVNATPQTMTVMAEVRTEGDTKSNGNIYLIKDGTLVVDNGETINTSLFKNSTGFHSVVITDSRPCENNWEVCIFAHRRPAICHNRGRCEDHRRLRISTGCPRCDHPPSKLC